MNDPTKTTDCRHISDQALLEAVNTNVEESRHSLARLIVFLGEVERRRLYLERAHDSMFRFCTQELGFSEGAAYRRIEAARLVRRFPAVLGFVASGRVHLSGLNVLKPAMTDENHVELLEAAAGKTKRQVQELVAARRPKPEPATSVRRLPVRQARAAQPTAETTPVPTEAGGTLTLEAPARAETVEPVAAERYAVRFAASKSLVEKLEELAALRSHRGEEARAMETMLEEAVDLLIEKERKARFAVGRRPKKAARKTKKGTVASRHIPAAVRREVYERDGGCCQFRDPESGRRCGARWKLTYEHRVPFGLGGQHAVGEITLLCAAHNRLMAERVYGARVVGARIEAARGARGAHPGISRSEVGGPEQRDLNRRTGAQYHMSSKGV